MDHRELRTRIRLLMASGELPPDAPMSITLVARAIEQCRASHGHLDASGRLLAHSRRLLNRAWWIARA